MAVIRVEDFRDAAPRIVDRMRQESGLKLVRIEGDLGVGKSALAGIIADAVGGRPVHGDEFMSPCPDLPVSYPDRVGSTFEGEVQNVLASGRWGIADAICLGEVLPEEVFGRGLCIYIKRLSFLFPDNPTWRLGWNLEQGPIPDREFHRSVHLYHLRHRPHETADIVIELPDRDSTLTGPKVR
jgi:hypothetical protein